MKPVLDPDLLFVVEAKGQPIGMALSLPDLCDPLRRAYPRPGTPELWTLLKFMYNYKVRKTQKYIRVLIMGVLPEYRLSGIDALLMATTADVGDEERLHSRRGLVDSGKQCAHASGAGKHRLESLQDLSYF